MSVKVSMCCLYAFCQRTNRRVLLHTPPHFFQKGAEEILLELPSLPAAPPPPPKVEIGSFVQLNGLVSRDDLNGKYGIAKQFFQVKGRWQVHIFSGYDAESATWTFGDDNVKVKEINLAVITEELRKTREDSIAAEALSSGVVLCSECKESLPPSDFSKNQLKLKFTDNTRRCKKCITTSTAERAVKAASVDVAAAAAEVRSAATAAAAAAANNSSSSDDDDEWEASESLFQKQLRKQQQMQAASFAAELQEKNIELVPVETDGAPQTPPQPPQVARSATSTVGVPALFVPPEKEIARKLGRMAKQLLKLECPEAAFPVAKRGLLEVDTSAGAEQSFVSLLRNAKAQSAFKLAEEALLMGRRDLEEAGEKARRSTYLRVLGGGSLLHLHYTDVLANAILMTPYIQRPAHPTTTRLVFTTTKRRPCCRTSWML